MLNSSAHDVDNSRALGTEPTKTVDSANGNNDSRVMSAWCAWLGALATDAEAALAAALAYKQLEPSARESWLSAVEQDAHRLDIPKVALFAPLLAVESDPERRAKILLAMGPAEEITAPRVAPSGLFGSGRDGLRIATVTTPLYLDFVQVLACAYRSGKGFEWVRHDPIVSRTQAPAPGLEIEGITLESIPIKHVVDDLAHAVVAHVRSKRPLPEGLSCFADIFDALGLDGSQLLRGE
jgi:hypothetical protein